MMARKTIRAIKSHIILTLFSTLMILIIISTIAFYRMESIGANTSSEHDLWSAKGISSYQIRIVTLAMPAPAVALDLTIQDKKIVKQNIVACDNPSEENPSEYCDIIRHYYSYLGQYTVERLFDFADQCTAQTQTSLAICPAFKNDFQDFSTSDEMFNAAKTCNDYLHISNPLCTVQYDSDYGYPRMISMFTPEVTDGFTSITVKDFRVTP